MFFLFFQREGNVRARSESWKKHTSPRLNVKACDSMERKRRSSGVGSARGGLPVLAEALPACTRLPLLGAKILHLFARFYDCKHTKSSLLRNRAQLPVAVHSFARTPKNTFFDRWTEDNYLFDSNEYIFDYFF